MLRNISHSAVCIVFLVISFHNVYAQWIQTGCPTDGRIVILTIDGKNIFSGTDKGVFLSTDNGTSWKACTTGMKGKQILALIANDGKLFASVGELYRASVFMSVDSGKSWISTNSGLTGIAILSFAVKGSNLFAGADSGSGVFVSTNNGTNWTSVDNGLVASVRSLMVSGPNLIAGAYEGLFLSSNDGLNWSAVHSGLPITSTSFYCFSSSGNNLFAGSSPHGVFRSEDNGASWTAVNTGLTDTGIRSIAVSGHAIFSATDNGIFLSTNSGSSWSSANSGLLSNTIIWSLAVNDSFIFAGTDHFDGIYHSGIWRRPLSDFSSTNNYQPIHGIIQPTNLNISFSNKSNINIAFYLSYTEFVTFIVYDLSGRIVTSLGNSFLESGFHSLRWNTHNIAAGFYTIRMRAGLNSQVKSILISR